jgi:hypothetical protein
MLAHTNVTYAKNKGSRGGSWDYRPVWLPDRYANANIFSIRVAYGPDPEGDACTL